MPPAFRCQPIGRSWPFSQPFQTRPALATNCNPCSATRSAGGLTTGVSAFVDFVLLFVLDLSSVTRLVPLVGKVLQSTNLSPRRFKVKMHEWSYIKTGLLGETQEGPIGEQEFKRIAYNGEIKLSSRVLSPTRTKNRWLLVENIPALAEVVESGIQERNAEKQKIAESRKAEKQESDRARIEAINKQIQSNEIGRTNWLSDQRTHGELLEQILKSIRTIATYVAITFWLWIILSVIGCMVIMDSQSKF